MDAIIHALASIKPEWIGGVFGALIIAVVKALGPFLARHATKLFQRKAQELERMAERKEEERAAAEQVANDPAMILARQNTELREEAVRLRAELARSKSDLRELGRDMNALASAKDVAEHEALEWRARAEAAQREADGLRNDMGAGFQGLPVKEKHAEVHPDPRRDRGAPGADGDRAHGGHPTDRPVRPKGLPKSR